MAKEGQMNLVGYNMKRNMKANSTIRMNGTFPTPPVEVVKPALTGRAKAQSVGGKAYGPGGITKPSKPKIV